MSGRAEWWVDGFSAKAPGPLKVDCPVADEELRRGGRGQPTRPDYRDISGGGVNQWRGPGPQPGGSNSELCVLYGIGEAAALAADDHGAAGVDGDTEPVHPQFLASKLSWALGRVVAGMCQASIAAGLERLC